MRKMIIKSSFWECRVRYPVLQKLHQVDLRYGRCESSSDESEPSAAAMAAKKQEKAGRNRRLALSDSEEDKNEPELDRELGCWINLSFTDIWYWWCAILLFNFFELINFYEKWGFLTVEWMTIISDGQSSIRWTPNVYISFKFLIFNGMLMGCSIPLR